MPTTPFHSDDANDANCISCVTTPQKSPPTQPQKTFPRCTLLPQHVPSLRVPFAGHPPRPPNYSLRSPNTTQLAPSTKAGFRNKSQSTFKSFGRSGHLVPCQNGGQLESPMDTFWRLESCLLNSFRPGAPTYRSYRVLQCFWLVPFFVSCGARWVNMAQHRPK